MRPDGLVVNVSVNGSPAPNGTSVTLEVNPAAAAGESPVRALHRGRRGQCHPERGQQRGRISPVPGQGIGGPARNNTATDTVTYYVRPHPGAGAGACTYFSSTGTSSPGTRSPPSNQLPGCQNHRHL